MKTYRKISMLIFSMMLLFSFTRLSFGQHVFSSDCNITVPSSCTGSWSDGGCVNLTVVVNGSNCTVNVCYCYRTCANNSNNHEYYIRSVSNTGCAAGLDPTTFAYMLRNLGAAIVKANPAGFPCDPCPSSHHFYHVWLASCWDISGDPPYSAPCASNGGWCQDQYTLCCDPVTGAKTSARVNGSFNHFGTNNCQSEGGATCQSLCSYIVE